MHACLLAFCCSLYNTQYRTLKSRHAWVSVGAFPLRRRQAGLGLLDRRHCSVPRCSNFSLPLTLVFFFFFGKLRYNRRESELTYTPDVQLSCAAQNAGVNRE